MLQLKDNELTTVLSTAQNVTANWADVGTVINLQDVDSLSAYVQLTIHDSTNVRLRLVALESAAGTDEYALPNAIPSAGNCTVDQHFYELNSDSNQKIILTWNLNDQVLFGKLQVQAGAVGATAGHLDSVKIAATPKNH